MKMLDKLRQNMQDFINAITRFPLTIIFLILVSIFNALMIHNYQLDYENYLLVCLLGAFLSAAVVMVYERFYHGYKILIVLLVLTLALIVGYYIVFLNVEVIKEAILVRTIVMMFLLLVAFLWLPSIKSVISFNDTFMAGFKALFIALFYTLVILLGMALIIGAIDSLLFSVASDTYLQIANVLLGLFAPIYFLAQIPKYPGKQELDQPSNANDLVSEQVKNAIVCPKFLVGLLSYIIIPLTSVFTLILLSYIIINLSGNFWKDDFLEVMLISYIIFVIMLEILISKINNSFANLFRKYFPKILIIIVLFQTINSFLRISNQGLTYGRYYVILFGIFALISGFVFSFKTIKSNGLIPAVLIICIFISLLPYIDAFTVSKNSQINLLEDTLKANKMLVDDTLIINDNLSEDDEDKIKTTLQYLTRMDDIQELSWLNDDFDYYRDLEATFKIPLYNRQSVTSNQPEYYFYNNDVVFISDYDFMLQTVISANEKQDSLSENYELTNDVGTYQVIINGQDGIISLLAANGEILLAIDNSQILANFQDLQTFELTEKQATLEFANNQAAIKIVVQHLYQYYNGDFEANVYVLIKIK